MCVFRCEGAAALPAGLYGGSKAQSVSDVTELIPSSQGSPIINPDPLMQRLPLINSPSKFCDSATTSPPSTAVRTTVFGFGSFGKGGQKFSMNRQGDTEPLMVQSHASSFITLRLDLKRTEGPDTITIKLCK